MQTAPVLWRQADSERRTVSAVISVKYIFIHLLDPMCERETENERNVLHKCWLPELAKSPYNLATYNLNYTKNKAKIY